jgi:hypothetical protein
MSFCARAEREVGCAAQCVDELLGDRGADLDAVVGLVVDDAELERVEESSRLTSGVAFRSCLVRSGEQAYGTVKYTWLPKTKATWGTLGMPVTQASGAAWLSSLERGKFAPSTAHGMIGETFVGASSCGAKAVTKGTLEGSTVEFE